MSRIKQRGRRDGIEKPIRDALAAIGVQTFPLSIPGLGDLLAYSRAEGWRVIECKMPKGKLTDAQVARHQTVPICIARSVDEALALYLRRS